MLLSFSFPSCSVGGALWLRVHITLKFNNVNCNVSFSHPVAVAVGVVFSESLYSHCREEMIDHVPTNISMIVSVLISLPNFALGILVTGKALNRGGGCGLEITPIFYFHDLALGHELAKK